MFYRAVTGSVLLMLCGCDRFYGVESRTTLTGQVNIDCIGAALASVPGVGNVTHHRDENRPTEIYPKQRRVLTVINLWGYGEGGTSLLQINQTPNGSTFTNGRLRMGSPVPQDEIARFAPLMRMVNKALATRCGLPVGNLQLQRL